MGTPVIDLTGKRFGRLLVLGVDHVRDGGHYYWKCRCDCGNEVVVNGYSLRKGLTVSCGCYREEVNGTHRLSKHPLYAVWQGMKARCNNPKNEAYGRYGGRGIKVCAEWEHDFKAFYDWAITDGHYETGLTIDRIDNDAGYSPANCRFVDYFQQANNRSSNRRVTLDGRTQTVAEWAKEIGIASTVLSRRLDNPDWSLRKALTEPVRPVEHLIEYNGEVHSKTEWAHIFSISEKALDSRLRLGWTIEKALTTPIDVNRSRSTFKTYTYEGKEYTLRDLCRKLGKNYNTVHTRLQKGWTLEEAITISTKGNQKKRKQFGGHEPIDKPSSARVKLIEYRGELHSLKEWGQITGLGDAIRSRLRQGWSVERAIETPLNTNISQSTHGRPVQYRDDFLPLKELCKKYGLNYGTVTTRLHKGMSLEEAMDTPTSDGTHDKSRKVEIEEREGLIIDRSRSRIRCSMTFKGETHTLDEWSKILGISQQTMASRLTKGWSVERILTTPAGKQGQRGKNKKPSDIKC